MSENGKLNKFWLYELTRPAFEDWLENEPAPVVIIGIGSIEQHGPHLPIGMDSLWARNFIHKVAKRTNSVAFHPCWSGYSRHHMGFKGTVTFSQETFLAVLMDTIGCLAEHGVKRFVISNWHGGNNSTYNLAIQKAIRKHRVMVAAPWGPSGTELSKRFYDRQRRYYDQHAGLSETSSALNMYPELVEMWRIPDDWKPTMSIHPKLMEYMDPDREDYQLVNQVLDACIEPYTDDYVSDGIIATNDPRNADPNEAARASEERENFLVDYINLWKTIPLPPAYRSRAPRPS